MASILLFLLIMGPLLALWTFRVARSKGRQRPWVWGLAAFFLSIPWNEPWPLLGMLPLLILIFMRTPQPPIVSPPKALICPKCQSRHPASQRYCISCGWELTREYSAEAGNTDLLSEAPQQGEPETPEPALNSNTITPPEAPIEPKQAAVIDADSELPVYQGPPTATGMTERGMRLFNLGRTQEAIDQFTKAIALDADFKEAWAGRADAYVALGREEEAAEDQRHLNTINPRCYTS